MIINSRAEFKNNKQIEPQQSLFLSMNVHTVHKTKHSTTLEGDRGGNEI